MVNAIVTGATGFVGIHLVKELIKNGVSVSAVCRENSANIGRLPDNVKIETDYANLKNADVFYHLAWEDATGPGRANAQIQAKNAQMSFAALEAAHKLSCKKFIAMGTVYEKFAPQIRTAAKFGNADFYILSKDYSHVMLEQLALKLGMGFVWATVCHPIGYLIKPEQMASGFISGLLNGDKLSMGAGNTLYDIVAVEDVAKGLYLLGECKLNKNEYYIGSSNSKTLFEYWEEIRKILNSDTPVSYGERPDDGLRFEEQWFDTSKLREDTGFEPKISFEQAVKNTADWVRR